MAHTTIILGGPWPTRPTLHCPHDEQSLYAEALLTTQYVCMNQSAGAPKEEMKMKKGKKGKDRKTGSRQQQQQQQQSNNRRQGRLTISDIVSETPATTASTTGNHSMLGCYLCLGYMWNKTILKWFWNCCTCEIKCWSYFKVDFYFTCNQPHLKLILK